MILMSGYASGERIERALQRGVRFLQKPFPRDHLLREIADLLAAASGAARREPV
jgi:CheY-like chemotaxis protein